MGGLNLGASLLYLYLTVRDSQEADDNKPVARMASHHHHEHRVLHPFVPPSRSAYTVTSSSFIALALIMLDATLTFSGSSLWGHAAIRATLRCLACLRMPKTHGIGRATSEQ